MFLGVAEGTQVVDGRPDSYKEAHWKLTFELVPDPAKDPGFYKAHAMEVSYTYEGFQYQCTFTESASRPAQNGVGLLRLDARSGSYTFSVAEYQGLIQYTRQCPDGPHADQTLLEMAGQTFNQPWDPESDMLVGESEVATGDPDVVRRWSWRLDAASAMQGQDARTVPLLL